MAFTAQDQQDLMYVIVGTFNVSPGRTIFNELAAAQINGGASLADIAEALVAHPLFADNSVGQYPISMTNEQFAEEYLTQLIGERGDLVEASLWDQVIDIAEGFLNGGGSRADLVLAATQFIQTTSDPAFAAAAAALANKVDVALYQAVDLKIDIPGNTLDAYRAPIADVDDSQASVDAAKAQLDAIANGDISDTNGVDGGSVAENAALGAAVGITAESAFVETGSDVTYALTDDAGGLFAINADTGIVTVAGALDAETATSHQITVKATNQNGGTSTETFTIAVTDVNDNGVTISDSNGAANAVMENMAAGTSVGITAAGSDADISANSYTYSLSDDAGGRFAINASTGVVTTAVSLDREAAASHSITVTATSNDGSSSSKSYNIEVLNQNEAPEATGTDLQTLQDTSVDGQITASDVDGDALTYGVTNGPASGSVNMNGDGTFTYVPTAGFAGNDSFDVVVSDGSLSDVVTVTVAVADVADVLTAGIDNITLSGDSGQLVTGSHTTYNPGDSITGSAGDDTLQLGITNLFPIVLGSATVNGVENLVVSVNPINAPTPVTLQMTGWDDALERIEIVQSTGHNFNITDIQSEPGNLPVVLLDDVSGNVMIDVDNQQVLANDDAMTVEVQEFGTGSSNSFGRANLTVDNGVETLTMDDKTLGAGFATDITVVNGGFTLFNVVGGVTGVDLTIQNLNVDTQAASSTTDYAGGFNSSAGTNITIDSTTFAGDLVADIDGAGSGTVMTGVGADELTAHDDLSGTVDTGAGADTVIVSDADLAGGSISSGEGMDTVQVWGNMTGSSLIDGEEDADSITVTGSVGSLASILGGEGGDTIAVNGGVAGSVAGEDGDDDIDVSNGITGTVTGDDGDDSISQNTSGSSGRVTGTMSGGDGDDTIYNAGILGNNAALSDVGVISGGEGDDMITQVDDMEEGSVINGDAGDDTIVVGDGSNLIEGDLNDGVSNLQSAAQINGGDGDDNITIKATLDGDINAGADNDTVTLFENQREGSINLEGGDDEVIFRDDADFTGDVESGPYGGNSNDGSIDGGAGENAVTLRVNDDNSHTIEIASDLTDPVADGFTDGTDITNIQTLNIEAIDVVTVGNVENTQYFEVDLRAFDTTLETINVLDRDNAAIVDLAGYDSEVINVDSDGDGGSDDITLNISTGNYSGGGWWNNGALAGLKNGTETLTVNMNADLGSWYDVTINDAAGINVMNLSSNDSGGRYVWLDGMDQDNNGGAAGEGNSLNISGDNTNLVQVRGVYQETIDASSYNGYVQLEIVDDGEANETLTITTTDRNDWVDMVGDTLGLEDTIAMGDGTSDRLVVDNSTRNLSIVDEDQVFENISGVNIYRFVGDDGGTLNVTIEDDFRASGAESSTQTIEVMNNGATLGNVDVDIDADYLDDHPDPDNALLVFDVRSGFVDIDNGADVDLDVTLFASGRSYLFGQDVWGSAGSGVNFTETGDGEVDVNVVIASSDPTIISSQFLNDAETVADYTMVGHVSIDVMSGEISPSTLTLLEGAYNDASQITLTWDDAWALNENSFTVDASGIQNNDYVDVLNQNTDTGGLWATFAAEDDTDFEILLTENDDVVYGGQGDDTIEGNEGDDEIWADMADGSVVAPGVQSVTQVTFPGQPPEVVEAGDGYYITLGGATYTWTAPSDTSTVQDGITALVAAINAGGSLGNVVKVGNIDDGDDTDDVSAADLGGGVVEITGTGEDSVFGYALGEDFNPMAGAINTPTAIVGIASEPYDAGDQITITIDGTPYTATAVAGLTPSTAQSLAADLAGQINADLGGTMTAVVELDGADANVVLRGNDPDTKYMVSSAWSTDLQDVPATAKAVTVTYTDLEALETASVTFVGGITKSAATVADLVTAINTDGTLNTQWVASNVGDVLTLTAAVTGSGNPVNDFQSASLSGGDGGTASWSTVAGTDFIDRTTQTDPTVSARQICFELTDALYDGGDAIVVGIDGTPYSAVLPGVSGEDDVNHDAATAAAAGAAELNLVLPAGYTASADGTTITVVGPDATLTAWTVGIDDVTPVTAQPEVIEIDYTGFTAAPGAEVTLTIGGTTYTESAGVDVDATLTALAAQVGGDYTGSYDPLNPGVVVITSNPSGVEPTDSLDTLPDPTVSGAFYNAGDVIIDVNDLGDVLVPASQVLDFPAMDAEDGATVDFGGTPTINVPDSGSVADTLAALAAEIEAQTDWNAAVTGGGTTITITSDTDVAAAEGFATASGPLDDIGDLTYSAPVPSSAAVPTTWTVTASTFDDAPGGNSISVTFDVNLDGADGPGDFSVSANTYQQLVDNINASLGTIGPGISGAELGGGGVIIHGLATGVDNVVTTDIIPVAADGANGTIGASVSAPTAAVAPVEWSQDIALPAGLAAGTIVFVEMTDGSLVEVTLPGGAAPANAAALGAALEAYFDANSGVDVAATNDGAQTVTITTVSVDPNNPVDPSFSIADVNPDGNEPYTDISAAPVDPGTVGSPADPADIELDFLTNGVDGQTVQLTLAAGNVYQGVGATINDAVNDLVTNVNNDTGVHGWTASNTDGSDFIITGPLNGTPPSISFVSAELITEAGVAETQESWENYDNTDPMLGFLSGEPNTDPTVVETVVPVAATTGNFNGDDEVWGGSGNDTIMGMDGEDYLNGEDGDDMINGGADGDYITGGNGNDVLMGGSGTDTVMGDEGSDTLWGQEGGDVLNGGNGNDSLFGHGGATPDDGGNDVLNGGAGDDNLTGGMGRDILTGGDGFDTFIFAPGDSSGQVGVADQVVDFVSGVDHIDLTAVAGFHFAGTVTDTTNLIAALNNGGPSAGRTVYDNNAEILYVDVDGNGVITVANDMTIEITSVANLTTGDFI